MKKFTLIELLVVVAIIGVLMSLLMPSLSEARLKAKQSLCTSNQKQIGIGVIMFSDEHSGLMPNLSGINDETGNFINWRKEVAPYLGLEVSSWPFKELAEGVFKCPVAEIRSPSLVGNAGIGYNLELGKRMLRGGNGDWSPNSGATAYLGQIEILEETAVTGDSVDASSGWPTYVSNILFQPSRLGDTAIGDRHFRGIVLLWADGHVKWKSKPSLLSGKNGDQNYFYKPVK